MKNVIKQDYLIDRITRNKRNGHRSVLLWFTGLSGSGKSTIANLVEVELFRKGFQVYTLDGDNIRLGLNKDLRFSEADRAENLRRIAEVSKLTLDAGLITLAAFVSPMQKDREMIKAIVGTENFIEIYVSAPLEVCEKRDVKGLYAKARSGEIKDFTGISAPYEAPERPDLLVETQHTTPEEAALLVLTLLNERITL